MKISRTAGLTLVELLVGMLLLGIVLTSVVNFFAQSSQVASQTSSRAELQQEILNAQQLIAGKIREAWYVYPPLAGSASLTLGSTALTRNPVTGNNTWKTATTQTPNEPLLAMILPPDTTGGPYNFLAYYPVKRSVWLTGVATGSSGDPGSDDNNASTWVLAEYRIAMPASFSASSFPPSAPPTIPTGSAATILSDYIAPTIPTTGFTTSSNTYTMFTYILNAGAVIGVKFNLAVTRQVSGKVLRLPNATDEYELAIYPSNLGKVPVP